jgi:predicted neutral ceramidase superfamily lipid hydrolase
MCLDIDRLISMFVYIFFASQLMNSFALLILIAMGEPSSSLPTSNIVYAISIALLRTFFDKFFIVRGNLCVSMA